MLWIGILLLPRDGSRKAPTTVLCRFVNQLDTARRFIWNKVTRAKCPVDTASKSYRRRFYHDLRWNRRRQGQAFRWEEALNTPHRPSRNALSCFPWAGSNTASCRLLQRLLYPLMCVQVIRQFYHRYGWVHRSPGGERTISTGSVLVSVTVRRETGPTLTDQLPSSATYGAYPKFPLAQAV